MDGILSSMTGLRRYLPLILLCLVVVAIYDAGYLTIEHYRNVIPPCAAHSIFADCGRVLRSPYAILLGVPLAVWGLVYYLSYIPLLYLAFVRRIRIVRIWSIVQASAGLIFSVYLVYLQIIVIGSLCPYCMLSAGVSVMIFVSVLTAFSHERKELTARIFGLLYQSILKPVLFLFDPEKVHITMVRMGEMFGGLALSQHVVRSLFVEDQPMLRQSIDGVTFEHPIGLAAGFDYEAQLVSVLAPWGFGFQTVGTITNHAYEGNPRPMLGRLPRSRSLLVNKGFKNLGADATISKLGKLKYHTDLGGLYRGIPYGVSIGRTNALELETQKESVEDIVSTFAKFEQSSLIHAYYELNISCPNLKGSVEFYTPTHLEELLVAIDRLDVHRPILVKMPIEKSDADVESMLSVIARHSPKGVIFGNLQKDRNHPSLIPEEVARCGKGNFSGKPTFARSNELISLAYRGYKDRFVIVGCGGIFSADDAYTKIKLGASLLQLITGMIFQGPQLVAQINMGLEDLLKRDGYAHLSQAVGADASQ